MKVNDKIIEDITRGVPAYVKPYKEPKVWGLGGIGEYWYGAGGGNKSSQLVVNKEVINIDEVIKCVPDEFLGKKVAQKFGRNLPLVKILTPKGRLSVQFHETKNELWIVTGVDKSLTGGNPSIILGFDPKMVEKHGDEVKAVYTNVLEKYGRSLNALIDMLEERGYKELLLETKNVICAAGKVKDTDEETEKKLAELIELEKELDSFYNYHPVEAGDVVPVPAGTLHALGAGLQVVEPQIAGSTQSLEDGATYPVRYYFPGYERAGAQKKLDLDKIREMKAVVVTVTLPEIISKGEGCVVERLPGNFEDKGLEVRRITLEKGAHIEAKNVTSFHNFVVITGTAEVLIKEKAYRIPNAAVGGDMFIVPASARDYRIESATGAQIIDTFTPV